MKLVNTGPNSIEIYDNDFIVAVIAPGDTYEANSMEGLTAKGVGGPSVLEITEDGPLLLIPR